MDFSYDKEQLLSLMREFYTLTRIKIVICDNQLRTLAEVPEENCAFCTALRRNPEAAKLCNASMVTGGATCRAKQCVNIYKCHAGLWEAISPIRIEGMIVGYVMLGQLRDGADEAEKERLHRYAAQWLPNLDFGNFDLPDVKQYDQVRAAAVLMESCVCYLLMHRVITGEAGHLALRINRYIGEHPADNLSVEALCERFSLSRNQLYRLSERFFGMPIARYVREKRIEAAAELIKSGVSVTEAATRTGFGDYTYFGKVFKSHTGKTPRMIRK